MNKEQIDRITAAWQEAVEEKKVTPVQEADIEPKMAKRGMTKCEECGGSSENHDEECSKYKGEACGDSKPASKMKTAESVRHEDHGFGEIVAESAEGFDVLFDHGVEFNVPAEQLEGVSSAIKTAKRMGGNMTGAVKKIDNAKKGMSSNPRVQKALKKANEEDELEEKLEKERVKHPNGQRPKGPGWVLKKSGEQSGNPHSEWERKTKTVESVQEGTVAEFEEEVVQTYSSFVAGTRAALAQMWEASIPKQKPAAASHDDIGDNIKGKGAEDMVKDADGDKAKVALDDEEGHQDAVKAARAVKKQAPARGDEPRKGDLKPEIPTDTTKSSGNPKIVGSQGE